MTIRIGRNKKMNCESRRKELVALSQKVSVHTMRLHTQYSRWQYAPKNNYYYFV